MQTENARVLELERENRQLKQANEILCKAAAFFAQAELDHTGNYHLQKDAKVAMLTMM